MTNLDNYTNVVMSIMEQKRAQALPDLKCKVAARGDDYKNEETFQTCLDKLVANEMLYVTQATRDGQPVAVYRLVTKANRRFIHLYSNASNNVSNDDHDGNNDDDRNCDDNSNSNSDACDDDGSSEVANTDDTNSDPARPTVSAPAATPQRQIEKPIYLALSEIVVSDDFRCRVQEDDDTVESYTEAFRKYLKANKRAENLRYEEMIRLANLDYPFPHAWVWYEGEQAYLLAGFHRYKAAEKAGQDKLLVKEFHGTKTDAILFAIKDNLKNALRMSYGDWKHSIGKVLILFPGKTPGAVAKELGCGRSYAYKIDKELSTSGQLTVPETRIGADGRERSVKRNITQPTVAPPEESDSAPFDLPNKQGKAASKPGSPTPEDTKAVTALVQHTITAPVVTKENLKPSSDLEREVTKAIYSFRGQISHHRQEDRPYVLQKLRELLEILEEEWVNITPQK